jgi:hypothetical protein
MEAVFSLETLLIEAATLEERFEGDTPAVEVPEASANRAAENRRTRAPQQQTLARPNLEILKTERRFIARRSGLQ